MSVPRMLVVTAVPFSLARLQSSFNPYVNNTTTANKTIGLKDSNTNQSNLKRMSVTNEIVSNRLVKKRNRILKNRISSQISREKAKIKKDLIEKQLLELQVEQMKIRLLNNELELRQFKLEEENATLKKRLGLFIDGPQKQMEEKGMDTLIHALFVYASLQKKWVLSHLPSILLTILRELLSSLQIQNFLSSFMSKIQQIVMKNAGPMMPTIAYLR